MAKSKQELYRFTSSLEKSDNKLWGCHFRVPKKIALALSEPGSRRVVCTLNGKERYQCAILHFKTGLPVISVNKKVRDSLGVTFGSEVEVNLTKDDSDYGLPLPEELAEVFKQDAAGKKLFHALTAGKQRTLLYIIGNVKDPEKRVLRSLAIVRHLKENKGSIDYKKLNILLRNPYPMK
ncbi:MAG: DUF1905 domain-containing protein [Bacteroidota bacterium]